MPFLNFPTSSKMLSRAVSSLMGQALVADNPAHTKLPQSLQVIGLKLKSIIRRTCTDNGGVPISVYIHIRNGTHTAHAHFSLCSLFRKGTLSERYAHLIHLLNPQNHPEQNIRKRLNLGYQSKMVVLQLFA